MAANVEFDTTVATTATTPGSSYPTSSSSSSGAGRRPSVVVNVNGYEYRNTVGVMGGKHMISISAAVRKETGLKGGDPIHVKLTVADTPRKVDIPNDFADDLLPNRTPPRSSPSSRTACSATTSTTSTAPKTPETRQRRIEKAVSLFRQGNSAE